MNDLCAFQRHRYSLLVFCNSLRFIKSLGSDGEKRQGHLLPRIKDTSTHNDKQTKQLPVNCVVSWFLNWYNIATS